MLARMMVVNDGWKIRFVVEGGKNSSKNGLLIASPPTALRGPIPRVLPLDLEEDEASQHVDDHRHEAERVEDVDSGVCGRGGRSSGRR